MKKTIVRTLITALITLLFSADIFALESPDFQKKSEDRQRNEQRRDPPPPPPPPRNDPPRQERPRDRDNEKQPSYLIRKPKDKQD
ncbi:MAG: hypothetical protein JNN15_19930 [Blastocatellia bacterium]|nr:hypothetical protein [Blastocatellia bacterium]